jgi:hypothetical protein
MPALRGLTLARLALALAALLLGAAPAVPAPKAELWPRWAAHDPAATATIDHGTWDGWLARYVVAGADGINRVAYNAVTEEDRAALDRYVGALAAVRIGGYARPEQMAYWINLYNAVTVQVVLAYFPVTSIMDVRISPGLFAPGPWGKKLVTVEGEALSLDDIEHRILRPIWKDARIHYVVNCASIGCPNLAGRAYTAPTLDAMLDTAARSYINHPRGAAIVDGKLVLSRIYEWYRSDFGATDALVIRHLAGYASGELAAKLRGFDRITDYRYDWNLNVAR